MSEKNNKGEKDSFWTTLPGCFTGIAAIITAVGTCIAALFTAGVFRPASPTTTPAVIFTSTSESFSPTQISYKELIVENTVKPEYFLPDTKDISSSFKVKEQMILTNEETAKTFDEPSQMFTKFNEWGRIGGYYIYYVNKENCKLKNAYQGFSVAIAIYKTSSGNDQALEFFSENEKNDVTFKSQTHNMIVGDESYITWYEFTDACEPTNTIRQVSLRFRKYNVGGNVAIESIQGSVSDEDLLDQALFFAKLIELKIVANASQQ